MALCRRRPQPGGVRRGAGALRPPAARSAAPYRHVERGTLEVEGHVVDPALLLQRAGEGPACAGSAGGAGRPRAVSASDGAAVPPTGSGPAPGGRPSAGHARAPADPARLGRRPSAGVACRRVLHAAGDARRARLDVRRPPEPLPLSVRPRGTRRRGAAGLERWGGRPSARDAGGRPPPGRLSRGAQAWPGLSGPASFTVRTRGPTGSASRRRSCRTGSAGPRRRGTRPGSPRGRRTRRPAAGATTGAGGSW